VSTDKQVLVVDPAAGTLGGVMEELDDLGFRVIWVPSLAAAIQFLEARPNLSLIIASAASGQMGGLDFLARVHQIAPNLRIIWGAHPDEPKGPSSTRSDNGKGPDSIIPEPFRSDDLRSAIAELLAEHFYPKAIAEAVKTAALEVLGPIREFKVEGGAFLVANQTALSDMSAVIPFGGGVSGHLMVGMTRAHAEILYRAFLPGIRSVRIDRMEDLVGELCNQVLGRINAFFAQHAVSIQHGTPIFIRAAGSTLRYPGRHPSFAVSLVEPKDQARVSLEYYLAEFDRSKLQAPAANRVLPLGEIRYL
jgi:CheY-specific phosphatase CheX/CheY-like chemotaxis protein